MNHLLAIDQGTTGTKALVFDKKLQVLSESYATFPQHFPKKAWVEHQLDKIWNSVRTACKKALSDLDCPSITAIGLSNQRETLCFWNRHTHEALSPAIVWQDRRTHHLCQELKRNDLDLFFQRKIE